MSFRATRSPVRFVIQNLEKLKNRMEKDPAIRAQKTIEWLSTVRDEYLSDQSEQGLPYASNWSVNLSLVAVGNDGDLSVETPTYFGAGDVKILTVLADRSALYSIDSANGSTLVAFDPEDTHHRNLADCVAFLVSQTPLVGANYNRGAGKKL